MVVIRFADTFEATSEWRELCEVPVEVGASQKSWEPGRKHACRLAGIGMEFWRSGEANEIDISVYLSSLFFSQLFS